MKTEPQALIIPGKSYAKAHAPDCPWALGLQEKSYGPYQLVPVSQVPEDMPNCRFCGGPKRI